MNYYFQIITETLTGHKEKLATVCLNKKITVHLELTGGVYASFAAAISPVSDKSARPCLFCATPKSDFVSAQLSAKCYFLSQKYEGTENFMIKYRRYLQENAGVQFNVEMSGKAGKAIVF